MLVRFKKRLKHKFNRGKKRAGGLHSDAEADTPPSAISFTSGSIDVPASTSLTTGKPPDAPALLQQSTPMPTPPGWVNSVFTGSLKVLKILAVLTGTPGLDSYASSFSEEQVSMGKGGLKIYLDHLMKSIEPLMNEGGSKASQRLKDGLKGLHSSLSGISDKVGKGEDDDVFLEKMGHEIAQAVDSFMLVNCISGIIKLTDTLLYVEEHVLGQRVQNLPHIDAAYNDYESKKKSGPCFEGTREALLDEISDWISALENLQIYLLSGIAGIGKSTVAYTVAERAERTGYLGASFFFSRDEAERSNAKRFFTTIAYQLCLYSKEFAQAIEKALLTERGSAAIAKDPMTQLDALILEPLRDIVKSRSSPIVTVVDALDECTEGDAPVVLAALNRLVQELPCFKVIVTTRPQPRLPPNPSAQKVFYLQEIEAKIINSDIQRYLKHSLSLLQVVASMPGLEWSADDKEIDSLVQAADKLFIMASTAVRFILDAAVYDPKSQMEVLKINGTIFLKSLGSFYNVILRRAVPPSEPAMARRFKAIMGTILVSQELLPIGTLVHLVHPWSLDAIRGALMNLQSVVALIDGAPRIYHKSFFDFLTDAHCDEDLRIDMRIHHTRVVIRCFQIMNKALKQNILDLGTPARFMDNDEGLAAENMTAEKLVEKIPAELRYACVYWANHIGNADTEDVDLTKEVETFLTEHLSHWLEALGWIRKLDTAYVSLRIIRKVMKFASSNLHGIISGALRFIPRFSREIHRSVLHIYYSALPCTPTDCCLYQSYSMDMVHGLCRVEGILPQWDALITYFGQGYEARHPAFSRDSSKFASSSRDRREMRLWDADNGMLLRFYDGESSAIADDFSIAAVSQDQIITLWSVDINVPIVTVTTSEKVVELALSFDGSRLAVGLSNDAVGLWDVQTGELMASFEGYAQDKGQLGFSPTGHKLAFMSGDGTVQLCNGDRGELVARLDYESKKHVEFVFSRDSCRLTSLVDEADGYTLTVWDGGSGVLSDVARNVGGALVIPEDGSFIVTRGWKSLQLWNTNPLSLVGTVDIGGGIYSLAISGDILAIGSIDVETLTLYDVNSHSVIATLQSFLPASLALSPDCTRLAVGNSGGGALYDVPLIKASIPASREQHEARVSALAFSPDSSRLASALGDGTVALWDTSQTNHPIATHKLHSEEVTALAFSPDGARFASGSEDGTARFWDGKFGAPTSKLEHSFIKAPTSVAFSPDLLAVATSSTITLFNHMSLSLVGTLDNGGDFLSFSADGSLLASASEHITVWNVAERTDIAIFTVKSKIYRLSFSPDGSQLAAQSTWEDGRIDFFDIVNKHAFELTGSEDLGWVPNLMNGVLISWKWDSLCRDHLVGRFSGHPGWVPILYIPKELTGSGFAVGSSIIALGCVNGRILFVNFPIAGAN